jgi:hypothetical protein
VGDPAYLLGAVQISDPAGWDGQAAAISADFINDQSAYAVAINYPWGVVLSPETSYSSTQTQGSADNGAATTAGAHAHLHVTASSGGTWAFTIEDSANDSDWATIMTFTANGSAVTSERQTSAGAVRRYVRAVLTRTSGSVTAVITFARNKA